MSWERLLFRMIGECRVRERQKGKLVNDIKEMEEKEDKKEYAGNRRLWELLLN